jgi:hypothetical protein
MLSVAKCCCSGSDNQDQQMHVGVDAMKNGVVVSTVFVVVVDTLSLTLSFAPIPESGPVCHFPAKSIDCVDLTTTTADTPCLHIVSAAHTHT